MPTTLQPWSTKIKGSDPGFGTNCDDVAQGGIKYEDTSIQCIKGISRATIYNVTRPLRQELGRRQERGKGDHGLPQVFENSLSTTTIMIFSIIYVTWPLEL